MFSAARYAGQSSDNQKNTMPGGVGPVSDKTASACSSRDRRIASAKNPNEIFFNLDNRRVFYDSAEGHLYFVDSPDGIVMQTVSASLAGLHNPVSIEQVYLDPHKCFHGARRVKLDETHANTLLIALRLVGCLVNSVTLRAPLTGQDKAHFAGNGRPFPRSATLY